VIWEMLADQVSPAKLKTVRVYETPKTWADYAGPDKASAGNAASPS
jgi:hypothetical protein